MVRSFIRADRSERAARLRGYFDLQLRFGELLAERAARPLVEVVTTHTNLHRRFGLGRIGEAGVAPLWREYLEGLVDCTGHRARVSWTHACFLRGEDERAPAEQRRFGCFACDPPSPDGEVRIHFSNADQDGISPLSSTRMARRRAELEAMFSWLAERYPNARQVRGTSWLYHLPAYRRLFPPAYTAFPVIPERLSFHGSSSWGQLLDHRERVKPAARAAFLARLPALEPTRLRELFPLPALKVTAPLALFLDFYGAGS